jgi:hypothetical protein
LKFVGKAAALVSLLVGLTLTGLGIARYRLPYENGNYFDPKTAIVYHLQAAEFYLVGGIVLTVVGLLVATISWRASR